MVLLRWPEPQRNRQSIGRDFQGRVEPAGTRARPAAFRAQANSFPMKPEKGNLIHDLLDEGRGARREATLLAGGRILRRRRWRRGALQSLAAVTVLALTTFSLLRFVPRQ